MNISDISLPDAYEESYDFRLFCRWFKLALSKVQYDTESAPDLYDPLKCPSNLLWMLADTMGFKYDDRLPVAYNRLVLIYFMSMIRNRGSKDGVTLAAETNLAQYNVLKYGQESDILYDRLEDTSIPVNAVYVTPHTPEGYIEVVYFSKDIPIDACIEYVRPLGMYMFQMPGVRFDARTKIAIDARLTEVADQSSTLQSTRVGHYTRKDFASMQKTTEEPNPSGDLPTYVKIQVPTEGRDMMFNRNTVSESAPTANAGYRALYSLQMSNNEHLVNSLLDPIFGLGYHPINEDDVTTYTRPLPNIEHSDSPRIYNLRYDKALDAEIGTSEVTTADESRTQTWPNVTPRVNPIMGAVGDNISAVGDAISLNSTNTSYSEVLNRGTEDQPVKYIHENNEPDPKYGTLLIHKTVIGDYTASASDTYTIYVQDAGGNYWTDDQMPHEDKVGLTLTYGTDLSLSVYDGAYIVTEDTPVAPEHFEFDEVRSTTRFAVAVAANDTATATLINAYNSTSQWDYELSNIDFDGQTASYSTDINPFLQENINRNWEMIISGETEYTTENQTTVGVIGQNNAGSGNKYYIQVGIRPTGLYLFRRGYLSGTHDTVFPCDIINKEIHIVKTDTSIEFFVDNVLINTFTITSMTGSDSQKIEVGYWYGGRGTAYFNGHLNYFKFRFND